MGFRAVFAADNGSSGSELWLTDGTSVGTILVKDINPGPMSSSLLEFLAIGNGRAIFRANSGINQTELWITDGTAGGTILLKNTAPGFINFQAATGFVLLSSGKVLFRSFEPASADELWITDGTTLGTRLVKDINPGGSSSTPSSVLELGNGRAIFSAQSGNSRELWITDGSSVGTTLLKDINPGSGSSSPAGFTTLGNGSVIFSADDGTNGREVWITDGTAAGTTLVKDIYPGPVNLVAGNSNPIFFTALGGGRAVFEAVDGVNGAELWVTDGTAAGTVLVKDINPGIANSTPSFAAFTLLGNGNALFTANDGTNGLELWITDGTTLGTVLLKDIFPGSENPGGNNSSPSGFTALGGGRFVFTATDLTHGRELWITDGTAAGTMLVKDIYTGPVGLIVGNSNPANLRAVGDGKAMFSANDGFQGIEAWITDGTAAGTMLLRDINLGVRNSNPFNFTVISGTNEPPGAGDDTVFGGAGNDILDGGPGADSMDGGAGNDQYLIDNAGDIATEAADAGTDTAWVAANGWTVGANIEITRLYGAGSQVTGSAGVDIIVANAGVASSVAGGGGDDTLWGSSLANTLDGGAGDDIIRGLDGAARMIGGTGNDQFVVGNLGVVLVENANEGTDTAWVAVSGWTNFANVEIVRLAAPGAVTLFGSDGNEDLVANQGAASRIDGNGGDDTLWGSPFADTLNGGAGDDIMRGQGGADVMAGGTGSDQYVVFDAGATVTENANEGYDIVYFAGTGSFFIGNNVEEARLVAQGTGLVGNALANLMVGNSSGLDSTLDGAAGNDIIFGTPSADRFIGGAGDDTLYSQGGADVFVYNAPGWGVDQIGGFVSGAKLQFTAGSEVTAFSQLDLNLAGGNTQVNHANGVVLVFGASLTAADFLFG